MRPTKRRRVEYLPDVTYFKPAGVPLRALEDIGLTVEELEAVRLKDLEGLDQEACAKKMDVSRATFQRILTSAREKIASALVNGKAIRIEGGRFRLAVDRLICARCGYEWRPKSNEMTGRPLCPQCESPNVHGPWMRRKGRRGGRPW